MNVVSSLTLVQGEDPDASKRPFWITDAVLFRGSPEGARAVSAGSKQYVQGKTQNFIGTSTKF